MVFNTNDAQSGLVARAACQALIIKKATDAGINGVFKVFYNGALAPTIESLPEMVDMRLVTVSEVYDQA